uniref:Uncharacterized protein n=1 Tax=Sciurus vulgaris TaxID=55149 RepID=A0A8D2B5Y7_SCIVU
THKTTHKHTQNTTRPAGLSQVSQELLVGLIGLQLVDVFHENPLVFEHIPLYLQVEAVIHVSVNLLRFTVPPEQPAQNPHPPHPGYLLRHWSINCAGQLTYAHIPALPASQCIFLASSPGMDSHWFADDQPIFDQLPDLLTRVGIGDFTGLTGVQPDLLFPTGSTDNKFPQFLFVREYISFSC